LPALRRKTGVGHYIANLYRSLQHVAGPEEVSFYPSGYIRTLFRSLADRLLSSKGPKSPTPGENHRKVNFRALARSLARSVCHRDFRFFCQHNRFNIYHEPNFVPWPSELPTILSIMDLSVLLYPQWHPSDRVRHHEMHFYRGMLRCQHFIAISEFTRQEMITRLGVSPNRVTATPLGIDPGFRPLERSAIAKVLARYELPMSYLLAIGTIEPRKNLLLLIRAYCSLPASTRARCPLILAGGWGWNAEEIAEFYHSIGKHKGVRFLGYLPDEDLPAVYNGSRALVYPSHYEGFGLPPLEMMACGGAVLASTAGSLKEILQGATPLIDPHDEDAWRKSLECVILDNEWWNDLRAKARPHAEKFSWDRCARETLEVYRRVA
jgi:alpha-1,3-rhamnosyl/mannosyltransferase